MERIWKYSFEQLGARPEESGVLITETPLNPSQNRYRIAQTMFETFQVAAMQLQSQAALTLFAHGKTSGLVVESGDGVTSLVPYFDGTILPDEYVEKLDVCGGSLTNFLNRLLREKGHNFGGQDEGQKRMVEDLKRKTCYVSQDWDEERYSYKSNSVRLLTGQIIQVDDEQFRCPEAIFRHTVMGSDQIGVDGLHQAIHKNIMKCDTSLQRELFSNILLGGGNTKLTGFKPRLQKEIGQLAHNFGVQVLQRSEWEHSAWTGGSLLASLSAFQPLWISRSEYDEHGPSIVDRK